MRELHLLGAGRAATAVARLLTRRGYVVGAVVTRRPESARRAVGLLGQGVASTRPADAVNLDAVTLIGVPDHEIAGVVEELTRTLPSMPENVVLHLSGSLPSSVLAPLKAFGSHVGSMHPAFAFASLERLTDSLKDVCFAVEGDPQAVAVAEHLVEQLEGRPLRLTAETKPLHHAACAVASNFLVTVFELAMRLERAAGAGEETATRALRPLMRSTLANLEKLGSPRALTGPIERGEIDVVTRHRRAIEELVPEAAPLFLELARETVRIAVAKGSLDARQARRMLEALEPKP